MGRVGEVIIRTWQTADKMKTQRGALAGEEPRQRQLPGQALRRQVHDQPGDHPRHRRRTSARSRSASSPTWCCGSRRSSASSPTWCSRAAPSPPPPMGDPNASIPTPQPVHYRPMFGAFGRALAPSARDTSSARRRWRPASATRSAWPSRWSRSQARARSSKRDMIHNGATPRDRGRSRNLRGARRRRAAHLRAGRRAADGAALFPVLTPMRRAITVLPAGSWRGTEPVATATLDFDERHRRRVRMLDDAGEPFLLDLDRPAVLADGDGLGLERGGIIRGPRRRRGGHRGARRYHGRTARLAWQSATGTRRSRCWPTAACACATIPCWPAMLRGLGARILRRQAPFSPEGGAYAGASRRRRACPDRIRRSRMPMATDHGLARLLTWLSPAFPVGAFSYSHGLEYAVEAGWSATPTACAPGSTASCATAPGAPTPSCWARPGGRSTTATTTGWPRCWPGARRSAAPPSWRWRAAPRAAPSSSAVAAAWPHPRLAALAALAASLDRTPAYPVAVGVARRRRRRRSDDRRCPPTCRPSPPTWSRPACG